MTQPFRKMKPLGVYVLVCLLVLVCLGCLAGCKIELPEPPTPSANADVSQTKGTLPETADPNAAQSTMQDAVGQTTATEPSGSGSSHSSKPSGSVAGTTKKTSVTQQGTTSKSTAGGVSSCTIRIECGTLLQKMDQLKPEKRVLVPKNGVLLPAQQVALQSGDTVFDVLSRVTRKNRMQMEFSTTPAYQSKYIEGIANLYQFDCGDRSGWIFSVNGTFSNMGVSKVAVQKGDVIAFYYTCDLGKDVGAP